LGLLQENYAAATCSFGTFSGFAEKRGKIGKHMDFMEMMFKNPFSGL